MNKLLKIGIASVVMFLITALAAFQCAAADRQALNEGEAGIVHVEGSVRVTAPSGAVIKAEEGNRIPDGSRIQTEKGRLQVGMSPDLGKSVLVEENSDVTVTPAEDTKIDIDKGSVFAVLDKVKPGTQFRFETPRGIAGVRGTVLRIVAPLTADKDKILVSEGAVTAFSPDLNELGGITAGNKGYIGQNQPLFTEPLSGDEMKQMQNMREFTDINKKDFKALVGGFVPRADVTHPPKKTGHAGGKASKTTGYDPEAGPTGPGGGFIQTDSRQFIDNRYMGHYDQQRKSLQEQRKETPREDSSHH